MTKGRNQGLARFVGVLKRTNTNKKFALTSVVILVQMGCIFQPSRTQEDSNPSMKPGSSYEAIIGEPLGPRKNYDLQKELQTFFSCGECLATAEPIVMEKIISKSSKKEFFTWVLREDGQLVFGKGPDEFMSHGVLATLNLKDQKATQGPMGRAYAGGEGYLDQNAKSLFLSNKSGHYRPAFSRINNSAIAQLFSQLVGQRYVIRFNDETKPPKPISGSDPASVSTYPAPTNLEVF